MPGQWRGPGPCALSSPRFEILKPGRVYCKVAPTAGFARHLAELDAAGMTFMLQSQIAMIRGASVDRRIA